MKPVRSLLFVFGLTLGGSSIFTDDSTAGGISPDLYGTWDVFEIQGNGMSARVRLTVDKGMVTNSTSCSYGDKSVRVQASSSAVITDDEISILENSKAEKEYEPGFLNCKVSLDKGIIRYEMIGDHLVLRMDGQEEVIELSRSGATFIQARRLAGTLH